VKDLTQGPIAKQVLAMALPIGAGMVFQTLYYLVDLYFVAGLGDTALAGVGFAGNVSMVIIALTQMLGVGTVTLVSHAAGRKDRDDTGCRVRADRFVRARVGR
jgi:Na+-driven multidrug efflux pump